MLSQYMYERTRRLIYLLLCSIVNRVRALCSGKKNRFENRVGLSLSLSGWLVDEIVQTTRRQQSIMFAIKGANLSHNDDDAPIDAQRTGF